MAFKVSVLRLHSQMGGPRFPRKILSEQGAARAGTASLPGKAWWTESGSEAGFAKTVETRQTDRFDKPVPEAGRRILCYQAF
ncbi:hypothetical protein DHEL01_v203660 [Diaporthe helianthi]|uniref:Uncharacterized protein n=1 Tax=Diaporthe helianthi TaxID=158607 RepID=A0A2P5I661_DIAHE|nr:hypothetical protein DHEL01_v203660 [Diaporthe helianthi]